MPDWFDQNAPASSAPQPASGGDWFVQNAPDAQPEGSAVGRFLSNLGATINPVAMVEGIGHAIAHPIDTAGALIDAQKQQFVKAGADLAAGHYSEALGHGAAGILPLVGPAAAAAGEQIGRGDIAGGLGAATGLVGGVLAPAMLPDKIGVPGLAAKMAPEDAAALSLAKDAGVPVSAATATGSPAIRDLQQLADRSVVGSIVSAGARSAEAKGLATLGEQLAAKAAANGATIAPEAAGDLLQQAIQGKITAAGRKATNSYDTLRQIEQDPALAREIEITPKPGTPDAALGRRLSGTPTYRFAPADATADQLFDGILHNARVNGFTGSAQKLREVFDQHVASAQDLAGSMAEGMDFGGDTALLRDIRANGGLRPFDLDYQQGAPTVKARGEFQSLQQGFERNFGQRGGGSVFRNSGKAYDDMLDALHSEGKWLDITSTEQLAEKLNEISRRGPATSAADTDLEGLLRQTGVQPGAEWWKGTPADNRVAMALPVDLRAAKDALAPVYKELADQHAITPFIGGSQEGRALVALKTLMDGPDYAPLTTVNGALSKLKGFSRVKNGAMRTPGQAAAAKAVEQLHDWVGMTAESAGDEAVNALEGGAEATKAKYRAADALKASGKDAMQAFSRLTMPGDKSIATLRTVAQQAPEQVQQIGRTWLESNLQAAQLDQGASVHGAKLAAQWSKLGDATKQILYPDPAYRADLDKFFRLVKMSSGVANPSGSGHLVSTLDTLKTVLASPARAAGKAGGYAVISKLMHSPAGVKLLTQGLKVPAGNRAALAAWASEAAGLAQSQATTPSGSLQPVAVGR